MGHRVGLGVVMSHLLAFAGCATNDWSLGEIGELMLVRADPICGRLIDEGKAAVQALFSPYREHLYYFCSMSCKQKFDQDRAVHVTRTDVVCRKQVEIGEAEEKGLYDDLEAGRYYFCSEGCRAKFHVAPEFYSQLHQEDQHTRQPGPDRAFP